MNTLLAILKVTDARRDTARRTEPLISLETPPPPTPPPPSRIQSQKKVFNVIEVPPFRPAFWAFLQTLMTDIPTPSYTSTREIPTLDNFFL